MNKLVSDGEFYIKGRGTVFTVTLDNEDYEPWSKLDDYVGKKGSEVQVNDRIYKIVDIERFLTGTMRPNERIGILVGPVSRPAVDSDKGV